MSTKVLLNRGMLAATLMIMTLFAARPAQSQTIVALAYDLASLENDGGYLLGMTLTGDRTIYNKYLTVGGTASYIWREIDNADFSRAYIGIGPGVRLGMSKVHLFGHAFVGALRSEGNLSIMGTSIGASDTAFSERYGGGIEIQVSEGRLRISMEHDGITHLMLGASFRLDELGD